MLVLQVPTTSIIHKMRTKTPAWQNLYRTLSLHIYGRGNFHLDKDMQKPGRFDHFPEETEYKSWFFLMSARTKIKCANNDRSANNTKKSPLLKGYISTKGISGILTIHAPIYRGWS